MKYLLILMSLIISFKISIAVGKSIPIDYDKSFDNINWTIQEVIKDQGITKFTIKIKNNKKETFILNLGESPIATLNSDILINNILSKPIIIGQFYDHNYLVLQSKESGYFNIEFPNDKIIDSDIINIKLENYSFQDIKIKHPRSDYNQISKEIPSWESYYNSHRKNFVTFKDEQEIKQAILLDFEKWQNKQEFETKSEWLIRIDSINKFNFLKELTKQVIDDHNNEINIIKKEEADLLNLYQKEIEDISYEYYRPLINKAIKDLRLSKFVLYSYDADNQSFLINNSIYGDILLKVPKHEASKFKDKWEEIKRNINAIFIPNDKEIKLQSLTFCCEGLEYIYDENSQAQYSIADIDYNFEPLILSDIVISNEELANIDNNIKSSNIILQNSVKKNKKEQIDLFKGVPQGNFVSDIDINIPVGINDPLKSTIAIIIANENYKRVPKVPHALNDGIIFRKYLTLTFGIPEENIEYLEDASLNDIKYALNKVSLKCETSKDQISLIIYYAGHGVPDDKTNEAYLLPIDGFGTDPKSGLNMEDFYESLSGMPAKSVIVLLDACFSGAKRDGGMLMATRGITIKPNMKVPDGKLIVLSATSEDPTAFPIEDQKHGLFTYTLLRKIQETNGDITWGELADYVTETVKTRSIDLAGKLQSPTVSVSPSIKDSWRNQKIR